MSESRSLADLGNAMRALLAWAEASGVPILVIGGVAVSILSKPRTTKDVDAVVWLPEHDAWGTFLTEGKRHGIVPRIPDPLAFALRSRVLLLQHEGSGVPVDVSMKAVAHRPRDIADIESLLSAHPHVDEAWVVSTVREFAEALDASEYVTDLVKLFRKRAPAKVERKRRPRKR